MRSRNRGLLLASFSVPGLVPTVQYERTAVLLRNYQSLWGFWSRKYRNHDDYSIVHTTKPELPV